MIRKNYNGLRRSLGGALAGVGLLLSGYNAHATLDPTKTAQTSVEENTSKEAQEHPAQKHSSTEPVKSVKLNTHTSLVDYLRSEGESISFKHRKKECEEAGIKKYGGTAKQNIDCLAALRNKSKSKEAAPEDHKDGTKSLVGTLQLIDSEHKEHLVNSPADSIVSPGEYTLKSTQDDDRLFVLDSDAASTLMSDYNIKHIGDLGKMIVKNWKNFNKRYGDMFDYLSGVEFAPGDDYYVVMRDNKSGNVTVQYVGAAPEDRNSEARMKTTGKESKKSEKSEKKESNWSVYAAPRVWAHQKAQPSYALDVGVERKLPELLDRLSLRFGLLGIYQAGNNDTHEEPDEIVNKQLEKPDLDGSGIESTDELAPTYRVETSHTKVDRERRELFGGRLDLLYNLLDNDSFKFDLYAGVDAILEEWSRRTTKSFDLDLVRNDQVLRSYGVRDNIVTKNDELQGKLVPHVGVEGAVPLGDNGNNGKLFFSVEGRYDGRHDTPGVGGDVGWRYEF